jgi:AcrR family transcriptional regulator
MHTLVDPADDPAVDDAPRRGRILWALATCMATKGYQATTIADIAAAARVSRATIYRMFPGGKDVLFEALRVRELEEFFALLLQRIEGATDFEDLLVRAVVAATQELRADEHLALALASERLAVKEDSPYNRRQLTRIRRAVGDHASASEAA